MLLKIKTRMLSKHEAVQHLHHGEKILELGPMGEVRTGVVIRTNFGHQPDPGMRIRYIDGEERPSAYSKYAKILEEQHETPIRD